MVPGSRFLWRAVDRLHCNTSDPARSRDASRSSHRPAQCSRLSYLPLRLLFLPMQMQNKLTHPQLRCTVESTEFTVDEHLTRVECVQNAFAVKWRQSTHKPKNFVGEIIALAQQQRLQRVQEFANARMDGFQTVSLPKGQHDHVTKLV